MSDRPLEGMRVVVTRAVPQAAPLIAAIEDLGGTPVALPLLNLVDAEDGGERLHQVVAEATEHDWLVVLSPNGAVRLPDGPFPGKVAAIASGTARVLDDKGYAVDLLPETASSVGLLEAFADTDFAGQVITAQAEVGRPELADGLRERGVEVHVVAAYRNVMPDLSPDAIAAAIVADVVVFASPSAVTRYVEHVGRTPKRAVCIGSVTASEAEAASLCVVVAESPTVAEITEALCAMRSSKESDH